MLHHGSFRSPLFPGRVRVVATGTPYVWRGAVALVEDQLGRVQVLVNPADIRRRLLDAGIGSELVLTRCGPGDLLRPPRCEIDNMRKTGRSQSLLVLLRRRMIRYFESFGPSAGPWLKAMLLGVSTNERGGLLEAFRATGLLHFIVVSGSHVTLVHRIFRAIFLLPANIFRALLPGRITFGRVRALSPDLLALMAVAVFCLVAGLDPPVQRAVCSLVVAQGVSMAGSRLHTSAMIASTFLLQATFWPVGFLSRSNLLSWVAWTIVLFVRPLAKGTLPLSGACLRQVLLMLAMAVFFGISSSFGIVANVFFLPLLELFFVFSIFICGVGPRFGDLIHFDSVVAVMIGVARHASGLSGIAALARLDAALAGPAVRVAGLFLVWAGFSFYAASTLVGSTGKVDVPP